MFGHRWWSLLLLKLQFIFGSAVRQIEGGKCWQECKHFWPARLLIKQFNSQTHNACVFHWAEKLCDGRIGKVSFSYIGGGGIEQSVNVGLVIWIWLRLVVPSPAWCNVVHGRKCLRLRWYLLSEGDVSTNFLRLGASLVIKNEALWYNFTILLLQHGLA